MQGGESEKRKERTMELIRVSHLHRSRGGNVVHRGHKADATLLPRLNRDVQAEHALGDHPLFDGQRLGHLLARPTGGALASGGGLAAGLLRVGASGLQDRRQYR